MQPYYRPTLESDIEPLAAILREGDKKELQASSGKNPIEALTFCFNVSEECNSIIYDDKVIGMFGCSRINDEMGSPWLLGSDYIPEIRKAVLTVSKEWVQEKQKEYKILLNYIDKRNNYAFNWLKYLGFTFVQEIENFGVEERPFIEFVRI